MTTFGARSGLGQSPSRCIAGIEEVGMGEGYTIRSDNTLIDI